MAENDSIRFISKQPEHGQVKDTYIHFHSQLAANAAIVGAELS